MEKVNTYTYVRMCVCLYIYIYIYGKAKFITNIWQLKGEKSKKQKEIPQSFHLVHLFWLQQDHHQPQPGRPIIHETFTRQCNLYKQHIMWYRVALPPWYIPFPAKCKLGKKQTVNSSLQASESVLDVRNLYHHAENRSEEHKSV